jgi:hypothetical protein
MFTVFYFVSETVLQRVVFGDGSQVGEGLLVLSHHAGEENETKVLRYPSTIEVDRCLRGESVH